MIPWQPLSHRLTGEEVETAYDGVPPHLARPLREWFIGAALQSDEGFLDRLGLRLRVTWDSYYTAVQTRAAELIDATVQRYASQEAMLDLVDAALNDISELASMRPDRKNTQRTLVLKLDDLLLLGGSAFKVREDLAALERRVVAAVQDAVQQTVELAQGTSAADHLSLAWKEAYGRAPDPGKAFSEAIKAVESAACPVVLPSDSLATLGKIRGELRASAELFEFAIAPGTVGVVIDMISTLWEGQTDRHGGNTPTRPVTQAAAESAVHTAATLVQWFLAGAIHRRPQR